jgi:hypothetical protein
MEVLTIRYSWQQSAALMGVCFLASTALAAIEHGLGVIAYAWSSPLFVGLMISLYSLRYTVTFLLWEKKDPSHLG